MPLGLPPLDTTLSGVEDYRGPHFRNIFLVLDPQSFTPEKMALTSPLDRVLHFGLMENEAVAIVSAAADDKSQQYKIIPRFYQPYRDERVLPSEIAQLQLERPNSLLGNN